MTGKNLHMMHAEDCVISGDMELTYKLLYDLYNFFSDKEYDPINVTVKYDGAPAIFAWSKYPELKVPGIAMKGLFNLNPIIYTKYSDMKDLNSDLAYKLETFLKHLPKIPENEIWQGDFLFDNKAIKQETINGELRYVFHPNTIMYVIPKELEKQILESKIGIVWHTIYHGTSLKESYASYDFSDYKFNLKKTPEVFMITAEVNPDKLGYFNEKEKRILDQRFHRAKEIMYILDNPDYKELINNETFTSLFKIYQNSIIKQKNTVLSFIGFIEFINQRFDKEIETRKSEKGKEAVIQKRDALLKLIRNRENLFHLMIVQLSNFVIIKEYFLQKLNQYKVFDTYLKMKDGSIRKTEQEGFALSDNQGNVIKLVDREEFSYANFSDNVTKGWV